MSWKEQTHVSYRYSNKKLPCFMVVASVPSYTYHTLDWMRFKDSQKFPQSS